jgi:phage terminase Nu1 subunit (DNA packaging protein)
VFVFDVDKKIDEASARIAWGRYQATKVPRSDRSGGAETYEDVNLHRARLERIKADRAQLALDSERGALVDAVAASSAWFAIGRNLRDQLLMLPDVIAPAAIGLVRRHQQDAVAVAQVRELIDSKIRECLQTITDAPPKVEV